MNIKIISLEKHRDRAMKILEKDFSDRLSKYIQIEFVNLKRPFSYDGQAVADILQKEAELIQKNIKETDTVICLDSKGKTPSSEQLAQKIQQWQFASINSLVFIIGGPYGLAEALKKKADYVLSLSSLTFTHEIARMLLVETLYRSFDILNNGNYHK